MMAWLPGPEGALRWIHAASQEEAFGTWSGVPLGLSVYDGIGLGETQEDSVESGRDIQELEAVQRVLWTRRKRGVVGVPAWDAASDVVLDLREFCSVGRREGWLVETEESKAEKKEDANSKTEEQREGGNDLEAQNVERDGGNASRGWRSWKWPFWA